MNPGVYTIYSTDPPIVVPQKKRPPVKREVCKVKQSVGESNPCYQDENLAS